MPRGTKLFGWLIIVLAGALLFTRPCSRRARLPSWTTPSWRVLRRCAPGLRRVPLRHRAKKDPGVNPETLLQIDRVIHEKGRLAIMSMLAASPELSFIQLRDTLQMTDGNLTTHIRTFRKRATSRWRRATGTAGG